MICYCMFQLIAQKYRNIMKMETVLIYQREKTHNEFTNDTW